MSLRILPFLLFLLLWHKKSQATAQSHNKFIGSIGAILDLSPSNDESKVQRVVMEVAVQDYQISTGNRLHLQVLDSHGDPIQAASAAVTLINQQRVMTIFGLQTWPETVVSAKMGDEAQVPILSFAKASPLWASEHWPFLLHLNRDQYTQLRAISSIISSWKWRRVTIIYEDMDYTATNIIPRLVDSVREVGADVDFQLAISPFSSISQELEELKSRPCRVFIVQASLQLATRLFEVATDKGMMEKEFAWIMTADSTNLIDSLKPSVLASMQGVIGIKSYYPQASRAFTDFYRKFDVHFSSKYPKEALPELDIFDLQLYDIVLAMARVVEETDAEGNSSYIYTHKNYFGSQTPLMLLTSGPRLLERISGSNFLGLSGDVYFEHGELAAERIFQIINVVGKSYREMGFWTNERGFSKSISTGASYSNSMTTLEQIYWSGGSWSVPRGWASPAASNPLIIGVPAISAFPDYINVKVDPLHNKTLITGFSIDIFKAALEYLPYDLTYELVAYHGTYDSLMEQVPLKVFDALVGDMAILSYRCEHVQFTQPYTQSGYVLVVPLKPDDSTDTWIFMRPFTIYMWISICILFFLNTSVVWLIERSTCENQEERNIIPFIWVSIASFFSSGERVQNGIARVVILVWMFVGLVLTSSYTASLSSMLTVQKLVPSTIDVDFLKRTNAAVGCNKGGSIVKFLENVLGFHPNNIKQIDKGDDYPAAFENGEIQAAVFATGHAKMFLAKYCRSYAETGPTFHAGGFGFVFPKNSLLLPDISEAILKLLEDGKMQSMENALLLSYNCSSSSQLTSGDGRLGPSSFYGLFTLMGITLLMAILLFYGWSFHKLWRHRINQRKPEPLPYSELDRQSATLQLAQQRVPLQLELLEAASERSNAILQPVLQETVPSERPEAHQQNATVQSEQPEATAYKPPS